MNRKFYLIVTAGGQGMRMGAAMPKQFLSLNGKSILQCTIEAFTSVFPDVKVITVLPKDHIPYWKRYCLENNFLTPQTIVPGGFTRFHSVKAALAKVPAGVLVAVHDGVRPFVSKALLCEMRRRMDEGCRNLIPCTPSTDTLKVLEKAGDGLFRPVEGALLPERSSIYGVQTPQFFRSEDIKAAYDAPYDISFTDDSSVALKNGIPLSFCPGERFNIKITTKEDLVLAEAILSFYLRNS